MRLDVSLEAVLARWPAGPFPPVPVAADRARMASEAERILDKVAEVCKHPLDPDLTEAVRRGVGRGDDVAIGLVADLGQQIWQTRQYAQVQGEEAAQTGNVTALGQAGTGMVALSTDLWEDDVMLDGYLFLGQYHRGRQNLAAAYTCYTEAANLGIRLKLPKKIAAALDNLGNVALDRGDIDAALLSYTTARGLTDTPGAIARIETNRARALTEAGRLAEASAAIHEAAEMMKAAEAPARDQAIMLDNLAANAANLDDLDGAIDLLEEARELFRTNGTDIDRFNNAWNRADAHSRAGHQAAAKEAFEEAHGIIIPLRRAGIDLSHYTADYREAIEARNVPPATANAIMATIQRGLNALNSTQWSTAKAVLTEAASAAEQCGLLEAELMARTNLVVGAVDVGDFDSAIGAALPLLARVRQVGDAKHEAQILWSLYRITDTADGVLANLHPFDLLAQVKALTGILPAVADHFGMAPAQRAALLQMLGAETTAIGEICHRFGADDLAVSYLKEAVAHAPIPNSPVAAWVRGNRLAALLPLLPRAEADPVVMELESLPPAWPQNARLAMAVNRALGIYWAGTQPIRAETLFAAACAGYEALRTSIPPGPSRARLRASYPAPYGRLMDVRLALGDLAGAFEAAQGAKEQRVLDALDMAAGSARGASSVPLANIRASLTRLSTPVLVDMVIRPDQITVFALDGDHDIRARSVAIPNGATAWAAAIQRQLALAGPVGALESVAGDPVLALVAAAVAELVPAGRPVVLAPDGPLHNLPIHALRVGGQSWCERNQISQVATSGVLAYQTDEQAPPRSRVIVAGDSRGDLPGARDECRYLAGLYGTNPLIGNDCSVEKLASALAVGPVDIIHLAVHGTGDRASGQSSGLLIADGKGDTAVVRFDELRDLGLRADVVVLSGCSTAVSGPLHGRELVGVALAAIEAGAQSVVGCLWPVDDRAAQQWMCEFHRCVVDRSAAGVVDLRFCMDSARKVLRAAEMLSTDQQVRDLREVAPEPLTGITADVRSALAWAPFVLFGSPFLNLGKVG